MNQTSQAMDPALARAEERLPRWMTMVALAFAVTALVSGHAKVSLGFAVGAALAILSYYWLHEAIRSLLDAGGSQPVNGVSRWPLKGVVVRFAIRYPLLFACVYVFYRTGWLPFGAVLGGLFVPAGGVLIEAVAQICSGWREA